MPNYDDTVLGVGNSQHPANQVEGEVELTTEERLELVEEAYATLEQGLTDIILEIKDLESYTYVKRKLCRLRETSNRIITIL